MKYHVRVPDVRFVVEAQSEETAVACADAALAGFENGSGQWEVVYAGPGESIACCQVCGCTDDMACEDGCEWLRPGLCSFDDADHAAARLG